MNWIEPEDWNQQSRARPLLLTDDAALWRFRKRFAAQGVAVLNPDAAPAAGRRVLAPEKVSPDLVLVASADPARHLEQLGAWGHSLDPDLCLFCAGDGQWFRARHPQLRERFAGQAPTSPRRLLADVVDAVRFVQMLRHYTLPVANLSNLAAWLAEAPATDPLILATRRIHQDRSFPVHGFRFWVHSLARPIRGFRTAGFYLDSPWGEPASLYLWQRVADAMDAVGIHPCPAVIGMVERDRLPTAAWRVTVAITGRSNA